MNVAFERPDLVKKVVADSFDGRTLHTGFASELVAEREAAMADPLASQYYEWCHGADWQEIVELDTKSLVHFSKSGKPLFTKSFTQLAVPLLLIGSLEDHMIRQDCLEEYQGILQEVAYGELCMFEHGGHPAIGSNAEAVAEVIRKFIFKN